MRSFSSLLALLSVAASAAEFDRDFTGRTLRVDYQHAGTAQEEHIALNRLIVEGEWPGSRTRLLDTLNLGKYLVEIADHETHQTLYSRGFASIYGEWETTGEARRGVWRSIEEAVRVPEPKRPVELRLRKRADDGGFREIWRTVVDPASRFIDRPPSPEGGATVLLDSGPPAEKVDLLILGDGYRAAESAKFEQAARGVVAALFSVEPFASRKSDFNVRILFVPAHRSGISRPRSGFFARSPLGARYNSFDSERYILTLEDRKWRDVAAAAPYDAAILLVNERKYGGGGIFNLYATAAADSSFAAYLAIHEFGHSFAGLGDEYFTSPVAYEEFHVPRAEPWEPNITALADPARLKWGDLVAPDTPVPTPWAKKVFEERSRAFQAERAELRAAGAPEERLEALFRAEQAFFTKFLAEQPYAGKVGAFEGAMYESQGLYRPSVDCIMFTRDEVGFCPVCRRAIERVIDLYSKP